MPGSETVMPGSETGGDARNKSLIKTGAIGATIMGVCCVTPALVLILGSLGFSVWVGWLDVVLLPGLAISVAVMGYGFWRLKSS